MDTKLSSGDTFPTLTLELVGGGAVTLPEAVGPGYGVVLFYRGHW